MTRLERHRAFLTALKAAPCQDCGKCFPPEAMDWDHVRGPKYGDISRMASESTNDLILELNKTELVCSNCHRVRTQTRRWEQHVDAALDYDADEDLLEEIRYG